MPHKPAPETTREGVESMEEVAVDSAYESKVRLLNDAIQEIGMGRYQWGLFVVAGFGYAADNLWPQATAVILPSVINELNPPRKEYLSLAQNIGLMFGACGWGIGSDIIGRRWAFNLTLLITGVFGTAAGSSPNFAAIAVFAALWSCGVGGNLPVDSALMLEYLPQDRQYLLTVMSIWWSFGQIIASALAWPFMANFACETPEGCTRSANMGWRYLLYTVGGLTLVMFCVRFFAFSMYESPKFLAGRGNDAAAVDVIHKVAAYNGTSSSLTLDDLRSLDEEGAQLRAGRRNYTTATAAAKRSLERFRGGHIRALFATRKMAISTSMVIGIWGTIGLAFPLYNAFLPYFLSSRGAELGDSSTSITFRNYLIIALMNIPGSILGGLAVELPRIGRKGAMSFATILTGIFLFAGTTARTSSSLLGWNCGYAVTSNMMYGVLYAYTPEIFPTKHRGTGNGLSATANRIGGIIAPVIAMYADLNTPLPIYISGGLFVAAGCAMAALPFEPMGKASM